jgi:hypothetical protein
MRSYRIGSAAGRRALQSLFEGLEIARCRLRELVQPREQFFDSFELHDEAAGLYANSFGEAARFFRLPTRNRELNRTGPLEPRYLLELVKDPIAAVLLAGESLVVPKELELPDEFLALDEERLSGLVTPEAVEELDGAASPDAE